MTVNEYSQVEDTVLNTTYYIFQYFKSTRVLIFIITVAFILLIKKILVERMDMPATARKKLGPKDVVCVFRYIAYSCKNVNSERLAYKEWKEENIP